MSILVNKYLCYPAYLQKIDGGVGVLIKNDGSSSMCSDTWKTVGRDYNDALLMGASAIIDLATSFIDEKEIFPGAANPEDKASFIFLKYHQALKIALRNVMLIDGIRPIHLCKELGINQTSLNKLLSLHEETSIDILSSMFNIVNRPIQIIV